MAVELNNIASGYNLTKINENFQNIEEELNNNVLRRSIDVGDSNAMSTHLDMGTNKITNLVDGVNNSDAATVNQVKNIITSNIVDIIIDDITAEAQAAADASAASAVESSGYADDSAASSVASGVSESAASAYAGNASDSEVAAAASAAAALASENNASTSETNAAASETSASGYAYDAAQSALDAQAFAGVVLTNDYTVTVSGTAQGDFDTLNEALEYMSLWMSTFKTGDANGGLDIKINLLAGYVMNEQVIVDGRDLSWIKIVGADSYTNIDRAYLSINLGTLITNQPINTSPAFAAINGGSLPRIGQLFHMTGSGDSYDDGILVSDAGSSAIIESGCGVMYAGRYGLVGVNGATVLGKQVGAVGAIFSDSGSHNIYVGSGANVTLPYSDLTNAGGAGVNATDGGTVCVTYTDCTGGASNGINAVAGAVITATFADTTSDISTGITVSFGGIVYAYGSTGPLSQTANTITSNGIIFK